MNRSHYLASAVVLSLILCVAEAPMAATDLLCGDINGSDDLNTTDALIVLKASVGQPVPIACGPDAPVFATGQAACYDTLGEEIDCAGTGQDAEVAAGATHRFAAIEAGTITDLQTSLMWEILTDDDSIHDRDTKVNWGGAAVKIAVLNGQSFAGHNDWRLPNEFELQTLINYARSGPSGFEPWFFSNCVPGCTLANCRCVPSGTGDMWSSTSSVSEPERAWAVRASNGIAWAAQKISLLATRAVREGVTTAPAEKYCADSNGNGSVSSSDAQLILRAAVGQEVEMLCDPPVAVRKTGQTQCFNGNGDSITCAGTALDGDTQRGIAHSFTDNGDGTVTDNNTRLVWEKLSRDGGDHDNGWQYQWPGAFINKIKALNDASFAGHDDWRVPNVAELLSIANLGNAEPAVDAAFNTNCSADCSNLQCSCPSLSGFTWSSTSFENAPSEAWFVNLETGDADTHDKQTIHNVRAVRGGIR